MTKIFSLFLVGSLLLVISCFPIGRFWVNDRWIYGGKSYPEKYLGFSTESSDYTFRYLNVWEYFSAKRQGYLERPDLPIGVNAEIEWVQVK